MGSDASRLPHPVTGELFASPVPPGTGWPGDPASSHTKVAASAQTVREAATTSADLGELDAAVSVCQACPRLLDWRESVAVEKRRQYLAEPYWGRPIAGWGQHSPRVLVVGLAPAAHGGNRTGRIFTGDRSGDWLFAALHRVGLAATPTSVHAGDGQQLIDTRVLAVVRCAPPANKPTPVERDTCAPWLDAELAFVLPTVRAIVCLGSFGWDAALRALGRQNLRAPRPRPAFGHGARVDLLWPSDSSVEPDEPDSVPGVDSAVAEGTAGSPGNRTVAVLGCYHPSQQNTFTGKLTERMIDSVLGEAAALASSSDSSRAI
ncbi:MAG: uracil-DNA glycosylase [Propionibacteriales bacterium]|nr:uracil-DNA glycosylase [Propionibacteriales bacterium]